MAKAKPSLHSNDKEGFIRAFTDEWKDIEVDYTCVINFWVVPSDRKGIVRLSVRAVRALDTPYPDQMALYSCEYPTAAVESFEACIFRSLVQLGRILASRYAHPMGKA